MFLTLRHVLRWIVIAIVAWTVLVYGLPWMRAGIPVVCARWGLSGGFCRGEVQSSLARFDDWVQRFLRPLPRHERVRGAVTEAGQALQSLEDAVRTQAGEERVDRATDTAAAALGRVEAVIGETGDIRGKLSAVPANADLLLRQLRSTFERLQRALSTTGRRAEEVSEAVEETQKALDALSEVLPNSGQSAVGSGETPH